jgi:gliding motility-associated-like protein
LKVEVKNWTNSRASGPGKLIKLIGITFFFLNFPLNMPVFIENMMELSRAKHQVPVIIVLFLLLVSSSASAQNLSWTDIIGFGGGNGPSINDMKSDKNGNLIVAGNYSRGSTLNGKPLPATNFFIGAGTVSFLAKFDTAGRLLWMDTCSTYTIIYHIEISDKGDYYFSGSCQYTGSPFGAPNPTALHAMGFIGKCHPDGKMLWVRKYLDYSYDYYGQNIPYFKIDKDENIFITPQLPGYPNYFTIDTTKYYHKLGDSALSILVKFDSSGKFLWKADLPVPAINPFQLDVDGTGNSYIVYYKDNIIPQKTTNALCKFSLGGQLLHQFSFNDNSLAKVDLLCVDNFQNVYIACRVSDTINFQNQVNTGKKYACLAKLDSAFNPVWRIYGSENSYFYPFINKKTNLLYLTGGYPADPRHKFKPVTVEGFQTLNDPADSWPRYLNFFIVKMNTAGKINWLFNSTFSSIEPFNLPFHEDDCGNMYFGFNFSSQLHFNGLNYTPPAKTPWGTILAKFTSDSLSFIINNTSCGIVFRNTSQNFYKRYNWYAKRAGDTTNYGTMVSTSRDLYYTPKKKGNYIITLQGTKSGGCSNFVRDTFSFPGSPVAGFSAADTQGCQYVKFLFNDTSRSDTINKAIGESWTWDFGDGTAPLQYTGARKPVISHVYTQSGTYTVKLVYGNGFCTDTFISQKQVTIIPAVKPGFTAGRDAMHRVSTPDTLTGCAPLDIQVSDNGQQDVVKWLYVMGPASAKAPASKRDSANNPSFNYQFSKPGLYIIHQYLTGTTGCVTEDSIVVLVTPVFDDSYKPDMYVASVVNGNGVKVRWAGLPNAARYSLYRYTDNDSANVDYIGATTGNNFTDDSGIDPGAHSYTYFIRAMDGCGHLSGHGRIGRTIRLRGSEDDWLRQQLAWNSYRDWPGGVSSYQITRMDTGGNLQYAGATRDTFFIDTSLFTRENYGACYQVKAVSNDTGPVSYSNIYCFSTDARIYIPNIFTPNNDSLNDFFAPTCMGIKEYTLKVYNRWDEKVYGVKVPLAGDPGASPGLSGTRSAGWNGTFKGQPAPEGIYIYDIKAFDLKGNVILRKGLVNLVR